MVVGSGRADGTGGDDPGAWGPSRSPGWHEATARIKSTVTTPPGHRDLPSAKDSRTRPAGNAGGPRSCVQGSQGGGAAVGHLLMSICMNPVELTLFTRTVVPVFGMSTLLQPGWYRPTCEPVVACASASCQ